MKFKKVEISAFRIFTDQHKGEFNFTDVNGEAADFVSIYAPNGFGKTSFYDAVEWCMTNNVQRFWQNESHTKESIASLIEVSEDGKVRLLKNTKVPDEIIPFVKIETDTEGLYRELRTHGNSKNDIAGKSNFEKADFRQVILSQEWISSFLRESNGEHRYNIFMQNPALIELAEYYKQVAALGPATNGMITNIRDEITRQQKAIIELEEGDLLETVNAHITSLQKRGEKLSTILLSFTQKDVLGFNNLITERISELSTKQEKSKEFLRNIDEAKLGLLIHFENIKKRSEAVAAIEHNRIIISKFNELQGYENDKNTKTGQLNAANKEKKGLEDLLKRFENYSLVRRNLDEKEKEKKDARFNLDNLEKELSKNNTYEQELTGKLAGLTSTISTLDASLKSLPDLTKDLDNVKEGMQKSEEELKVLNGEINNKRELIEVNERNKTPYLALIAYLNGKDFTNLHITTLDGYTEMLKAIQGANAKLKKLKDELSTSQTLVESHNKLSDTFQDFIQQGMKIVMQQKTSTCPLCTSTFDSFENLLNKVLQNDVLSARTQELLQSTATLQHSIDEVEGELAKNTTILQKACNDAVEGHQHLIEENERIVKTLLIKKEEIEQTLKGYEDIYNAIQAILSGLTVEDYGRKLQLDKETADSEVATIVQALQDARLIVKNLKDQHSTLLTQMVTIEKEITSLSLNEDYLVIVTWFKENLPTSEISKLPIETKLQQCVKNLGSTFEEIKDLQQRIDSLTNELATFNQNAAEQALTILEKEKIELSGAIIHFESFFLRSFSVNAEHASVESLAERLESLEQSHKMTVNTTKELEVEYKKLQEYNTNLLPFLQSESAKLKIRELNKEIDQLQNSVIPYVEKERQSLQTYLEKQIESYFYTGLINQIYKKIDPHPDFKEVKFVSDFGSESPRLDVFVTNSSGEKMLIPNLYFSTAQINILSLSIFLASALNSERYDCIFIDDPIQSMDSINVLSTIDLLRGIISNRKKQIILSTHDSNFHHLLQKKIPTGLYKSKFIEFETFGKVKVD